MPVRSLRVHVFHMPSSCMGSSHNTLVVSMFSVQWLHRFLQARFVSDKEAEYVPSDLVSNFGSLHMDLDLNDLMVRPASPDLPSSALHSSLCVLIRTCRMASQRCHLCCKRVLLS